MSSAIFFREQHVWGSNGAIEEVLIKLIKYSPDDSRLLAWALEQYRDFFPGICCDLGEVLVDEASIEDWRQTIQTALEDIRASSGWTPYGIDWIDRHAQLLIHIADPAAPA